MKGMAIGPPITATPMATAAATTPPTIAYTDAEQPSAESVQRAPQEYLPAGQSYQHTGPFP